MAVIKARRMYEGDDIADTARKIEAIAPDGFRFTPDQYRAAEQGLTKNVNLWMILYAAHAYQIPADLLFPTLDEY